MTEDDLRTVLRDGHSDLDRATHRWLAGADMEWDASQARWTIHGKLRGVSFAAKPRRDGWVLLYRVKGATTLRPVWIEPDDPKRGPRPQGQRPGGSGSSTPRRELADA